MRLTGWLLRFGAIALAQLVQGSLASAQPVTDMPLVASEGIWELRVATDPFTDQANCIIVVTDQPWVQVSPPDSLYIGYGGRGGVQGFQYRVDDHPVGPFQLPDDIHREIGVAAIEGEDFRSLLSASRLRVQTLTYVNGLQNEDLDLRGLASLFQKLTELCPSDSPGKAP